MKCTDRTRSETPPRIYPAVGGTATDMIATAASNSVGTVYISWHQTVSRGFARATHPYTIHIYGFVQVQAKVVLGQSVDNKNIGVQVISGRRNSWVAAVSHASCNGSRQKLSKLQAKAEAKQTTKRKSTTVVAAAAAEGAKAPAAGQKEKERA